ncbi:MAG TPA: hypothetical protein VL334_09685 [Anaerolineae bacterium]|nr:hypothetical protein [Anaerolineae bacterium]
MDRVSARLRVFVAARAMESCEYCLIHAAYTAFVHEIDHIVARNTVYPASPEERAKCELNRSRTMIIWDPEKCAIIDEIRITDYFGPAQ